MSRVYPQASVIAPVLTGVIFIFLFAGTMHALDTFTSEIATLVLTLPLMFFSFVSIFGFVNAVSWWHEKVQGV